MQNLIGNANLLDQKVGDYKINSTFQTASGTTNVEIRKSKLTPTLMLAIIGGIATVMFILFMVLGR